MKAGLEAFYLKVEETENPTFFKAIQTFKNWQVEILNSYVFGYSSGFLVGINILLKWSKETLMTFESMSIL